MNDIINERIRLWADKAYEIILPKLRSKEIIIIPYGKDYYNLMAVSTITGEIGRAELAKGDMFNYKIGVAIAVSKLFGTKIPDIVYGGTAIGELVGKWILSKEYGTPEFLYVTPIVSHGLVLTVRENGTNCWISEDTIITKKQIVER